MSDESKSIIDEIILELGKVFLPLVSFNSPARVTALLKDLGWELPNQDLYPSTFPDLEAIVSSLQTTLDQIESEQTSDEKLENFITLGGNLRSLFDIVFNLKDDIESTLNAYPNFVNNSGILTKFHTRLIDYLFVLYLQTYRSRIYSVLTLMGLIEKIEYNENELSPYQPKFVLNKVHWDRCQLLGDPLSFADKVYDWETSFKSNLFLNRLYLCLGAFSLPGGLYNQHPSIRNELGRQEEDTKELRVPFFQTGEWPANYAECGVNVAPVPEVPEDNKGKGFAIIPYLREHTEFDPNISPTWEFKFTGSAGLDSGIGLKLTPPHNVEFISDLFSSPDDSIDVQIKAKLKFKNPDASERLIFGYPDATRLSVKEVGFSVSGSKTGSDQVLAVEMEITEIRFVVKAGDSDGFLHKILPEDGINTTFDFGIGWSSLDGIYFRGSAALEVTIPVHKELGPITIQTVYLKIGFDGGIKVILATSVSAEIGPISASVDQIGIKIPISFPNDKKGNLGPIHIEGIRFKPPTGVGMLVDADVVTGGGFIQFDTINKRYAGTLQLSFGEIGLTAIGLITTRMPDGSPGFSLLISVSVEFSPEIQLTMGFTLSAVGGLIGVNRTMDLAALEKRFRNRALDSILFPKDPILNASKIISDLRAVFPPKEDRYVIGAMVAIGYGNPNIIRGEIGIFIEIPEPIRASIMGQISAILPEEDNPIVVLNLDVLGIIRPSKKKITIDSVLYDSRILYLNLFGDAAIWLKWGQNPQFIMSLGGFHPKFTPPPGFPKLQRLTLALNWGNTLFMLFQFYMAITPNSLQFGTNFDITIKWGKAVITGGMSFDALFYFSPFSFDVDITGYVVAKAFGKELSSIRLYFNLSGPTPWHAIGSARFKILFVKFKVDFDIIKGSVRTIDPIPAIDPWDPLKKALERREAWSSSLPPTRNMVESLRPIDESSDVILVHPAGKIEVRENVLPLGFKLDKFGNAPIKDHHTFNIKSVTSGEVELDCIPIKEYFAKKPFKNLSFKEQLSSESYELEKAGVEISSEAIKVPGKLKDKSLDYESIVINDDRISKKQDNGKQSWESGKCQTRMNATGQSLIRNKGLRAFEIWDTEHRIHVNEEKCRIVLKSNMKSVSAIQYIIPNYQEDMRRSEAEIALGKYLKKHPEKVDKVQIVNSYEVSA